MRRLAELLSRGVVLRRRFSARFGRVPLLVTPESSLRYWHWSLDRVDPFLLDLAEEFVGPGDMVWDVGANVGLFAFAAAARAGPSGRVLALEPDPLLAGLLRRSAALDAPARAPVEVLAVAADAACGSAEFHISSRGRAANYLAGGGSSQAGGSREVILVSTVTLDSLLDRFPAPRFVKIDVENLEYRVLQGASRVLASVRPIVVCEVCGRAAPLVTRLFHQFGYTLYNAELPASHRSPLPATVRNTLACPAAIG